MSYSDVRKDHQTHEFPPDWFIKACFSCWELNHVPITNKAVFLALYRSIYYSSKSHCAVDVMIATEKKLGIG